MRTDSFYTNWPSIVVVVVVCFALVHDCVAQTPTSPYQRNSSLPPQPPSPLSQFATPNGVIDVYNTRSEAVQSEDEFIVTKDVDLRGTLHKYAQFKKCSLDQAFADTVACLKMMPLQENDTKRVIGTQAFYSIVEKDIYRITAPRKFFNRLTEDLLWIEHGKRYVRLEVHFLQMTPARIESLQTFLIPGSYVAFNNKFPEVIPYATQASFKDSARWRARHPESNGTFVVASETKTKIYPTFLGRLTDQGVSQLITSIKADSAGEITLAPRLRIIPGQTATVTDAATRPFVVGLKRIEGDFAVAHQPIIQSVEDGVILKLRAVGENNEIRLDGDLALCEISSVSTFKLPTRKGKQENEVSVQVPEQKLKQVHWSTLIKKGETLLIDPVFEKVKPAEPPTKGKKNFTGQQTRRVLVLIKPSFLESSSAPPR